MEQTIDKEFIEIFKEISLHQGFDHLMAEIYGLIYISKEEICLDEVSKKTGFSLASISNKVKFMENVGLITRFTKPGSRKIYLSVEKNILKLSKDNLINQKTKSLQIAKQSLPNLIEKYKKKSLSNENKFKLNLIENYYNQLLISEKLIDKIIKDFDKILDGEKFK